ncbi:early nodulin-93-like isoform X2 [Diospyros lotus]|uniref:early nodulin-93-like isoform X2 n=1 Tax=Diospyros lotus TaxID=55363 RepID=UPI0022514AD7|nr:early nodulin-93-like isoform X2 [Diospyros lotus]
MGEGGRERERRKRAATTTMNNPSCFWVSTMYIKSQRSWVSLRKMEESLPKTAAKLVAVRTIPWAKANINHTGQALIISRASVAATYFITAHKTILKASKKNASYDRTA